MSNTSNEMANRGSKLCMQICVNNLTDDIFRGRIIRKSRKHLLDDKIGHGKITWISPLATENFEEYQLNNNLPVEKKKLLKLENVDFNFWPKGVQSPQWDAIGVAEDSFLILVEAKGHTSEFKGPGCKANVDKPNRPIIKETITQILGDDEVWMGKYYQTANRIVFLKKLLQAGVKVLLVYLCFINDFSNESEPQSTWDQYIKNMNNQHPLPPDTIEGSYIKHIYLDIWQDKGV